MTALPRTPMHFAWPTPPDTLDSAQMVEIARMIERICGTEAAVHYLADAVTVLRNRWRPVQQLASSRGSGVGSAGVRSLDITHGR